MVYLDRVREALARTKEHIRAYISSSEVGELRAEAEVSDTERLRIAQTCEEFERVVREMLVAATPTPEEEVLEEEEKQAAQGAQEGEQET